ncbi:Kelch-type beta propeller [Arabidopsis thaliana x Arabidopsis arenosa]|uniref:FKB95-like N-terminal Kelch domain-containing protein n=2 Tax=Arabidopsis TaxID=3701 RepID=A0A178VV48_ARATH|nr:Kelch-type beta propeller [Arabidopsis thaliana x Arabidopsis arenosa]OAP09698.1 hypothetical protein AXX17_AT2G25740 [Arabidopsis thaliana]
MAIISETSDDGSHGGVPNKKPEELHKNPKEDDHQEEEVENHPPIPRQIPQALIRRTVALIKRCHYPSLSLLSKAFRIVISSPELHQTRSSLNLTEPVLYALIGFPPHSFPNWFILNHNITRNIPLRLSAIGSLPPMNPGSAVVTIGYKMYVIGGLIGPNNPVKTVFVIDCRVHTCNYLPTMHRARYRAVAEVINGKIYVIGGGGFVTSVVMQNKIYILDATCGLVYDPIDGTWESGELGTTLKSYWYKPCCVIEDLLYSFDPYCLQGSPINVYDPNVMVWTPMMGTGIRAFPDLDYFECKMANFGGKLMVFGATYNNPVTDTWCIEMALIKGETGPILGMINSMVPVLRSVYSPYIDLCRSVTF